MSFQIQTKTNNIQKYSSIAFLVLINNHASETDKKTPQSFYYFYYVFSEHQA